MGRANIKQVEAKCEKGYASLNEASRRGKIEISRTRRGAFSRRSRAVAVPSLQQASSRGLAYDLDRSWRAGDEGFSSVLVWIDIKLRNDGDDVNNDDNGYTECQHHTLRWIRLN